MLAAAIEDQLGLKLEATQVPFPILVIEKVNRVATPNSARDVTSLAVKTPEFEVAEIKPFDMSNVAGRRMMGLQFPPSGRGSRVTISGVTLTALIQQAWNQGSFQQIVGLPKSFSGSVAKNITIVAKAPAGWFPEAAGIKAATAKLLGFDAP